MKNLLLVCVFSFISVFAFGQKEEDVEESVTKLSIETKTSVVTEDGSEIEMPTIIKILEETGVMRKIISGSIDLQLPDDIKNEKKVATEIFELYIKKIQPILAEGIVPVYLEIYQEHFSDKELNDLLAFYETDLGQKLIAAEYEMFVKVFAVALRDCGYLLDEATNEVLAKEGYKKGKSKKKK